jgi:YVTN family beta-propeller protein
MNKQTTILSAAVVVALLLSATILAGPTLNLTGFRMPQVLTSAFAATVDITLTAEKLPNGQFAYKLDSALEATIPGPTIMVTEGDTVNIELTNNIPAGGPNVGFTVEGLSVAGDAEAPAGGGSESYSLVASSAGTYIYKDNGSDQVGLFGAIIVNKADGIVESYVQGTTGVITTTHSADLDKEFVLFMVGSTFWGQELTNGGDIQTPLWTNPMLSSEEGDIVRFHILSIGHGHTFHLHAHRWVDPGTSAIIDTKIMQTPQDNHVFTVKAGDQVGPGDWQYHCHVFAHMEAGMHGIFRVVPSGENDDSERGATPYGVHPIYGLLTSPDRGLVTFEITDEGGSWFKATNPLTATQQSLQLARPGDSVQFIMSKTNTVHTITSLLWPTGAEHFPMDEVQSYKGGGIVEMDEPGLYVFTCKVHPYMFGGVIVDDPDTMMEANPDGTPKVAALGVLGTLKSSSDTGDKTIALDLGDTITLVTGLEIPTGSDLALRLASTFFKATDSANWKDYRETTYNPSYPPVPVQAAIRPNPDDPTLVQIAVTNLDVLLDAYFGETTNQNITGQLINPTSPGVGEVWVDTQFEHTSGKTKPGTATAVNATTWEVTKKVSLPSINMNNPHNMWTDKNQMVIYQTEWFDNKLSTFDRSTGALVSTFVVGEAPSHVMTRTDTDDIHVALNGEDGVSEILATTNPTSVNRIIPMQGLGQDPTHPHAHWMSADGQKMVTPNSFTGDTSLYGFDTGHIEAKTSTGAIPIATGMMPDSSKYYVANLLSSTISVIDMTTGENIKDINLLADYNPFPLQLLEDLGLYFDVFHPGFHHPTIADFNTDGVVAVGALPIQTPVSPDGTYMVTANTLSGTITIVDTSTDEVVKMLLCEPGCHGVQFGAKQGGGYYAYVSSKFANDLIVVDADQNGDGDLSDAAVVGKILLAPESSTVSDDTIVDDNFTGQGGQGVLAIPVVYNGWVQNLPSSWKSQLTTEQQNPIGT